MTLTAFASSSRAQARPPTPDSVEHHRRTEYRQSRASTNSSFFSHESHGPQTPRVDSALSLVICSDDSEYRGPEDIKSESWWADLTPRVPQLGSSHPDADVCIDDSPTLPDISIALLKHFPRPPTKPERLAPPRHPYSHPSSTSSARKSESTETLHAETNSSRRPTPPPPRTKAPERPLPLDPEQLAEVNRALRDLGLQELASASVLSPEHSPRHSSGSQARQSKTPSDRSESSSLKSSKSLQSIHSVAPSIPGRTSSRRTPSINSRASSLKLIRTPYGVPTEPPPIARSSWATSGLSRLTSTDSWSSTSASSASAISAKSSFRSPRSSYRNSSIRSVHSAKLPSITELPRDLDVAPTGEWALRDRSPYRQYGASKSTPDLCRARDSSLGKDLRNWKQQGGSPPLHGPSFVFGESTKHWRAPARLDIAEASSSWDQRLAALKTRLLVTASELSLPSGDYNPSSAPSLSSPIAESPPLLGCFRTEERKESLLDNVRAMVEAKGWDWPAPPDFSAPAPDVDEAAPSAAAEEHTSERPASAPHESSSTAPNVERANAQASASAAIPNEATSPFPIVSSLAPPPAGSDGSHDPNTPTQTYSSALSATSMPRTPHTPSISSSRRPSRTPAAALDLAEELDAIDRAEAARIAEEEKAKAIANGTYVDLYAPRTRAIGFSAPSSVAGSDESAPSIFKAKMKKEAALPPTPAESKGPLGFLKSLKRNSK